MKEKIKRRIIGTIMSCIIVMGLILSSDIGSIGVDAATPGVTYNSYVQSYGWLGWKSNGTLSGTTGQAKRMEALKVKLTNKNYSGSVVYRAYVQKEGWQGWKSNGDISGTVNKSKRLEAIQIKLTQNMAKHYDIYYRVQVQSHGWLGWAKNGASAGTAGMSRRIEGIQIKLVKKGSSAPGSTSNAYLKYSDNLYSDTVWDNYLDLYKSGFFDKEDGVEKGMYYRLYDVNGDGIKELMISKKYSAYGMGGFYSYKMYTIVKNKVKEVSLPTQLHGRNDFIVMNDKKLCISFNSDYPSDEFRDFHFYTLTTDGRLIEKYSYEVVWDGYYGGNTVYYYIKRGNDIMTLTGEDGKIYWQSALWQELLRQANGVELMEY